VQIDWRIVDNATREVVKGASGSAVGMEKGGGFNFNSWGGGGFSNNREFMGSALGKATVKAIAQIVESVKGIQLAAGARSTLAAEGEQKAHAALRKIAVRWNCGWQRYLGSGRQTLREGDKSNFTSRLRKISRAKSSSPPTKRSGKSNSPRCRKTRALGFARGAPPSAKVTAVDGVDIDSTE
jgi:hypothetical protein